MLKRLKRMWLAYWLRVTLRYVGVKHKSYSNDELFEWLKEWADKITFRKTPLENKHFPPNYIEMKPAEAPVTDEQKLLSLAVDVDLTYDEMYTIYEKCEKDYRMTSNVVSMMAITYMTDDAVISQYEQLYLQLKHRLNQ